MTENEVKAVRFIKSIMNHAVIRLDAFTGENARTVLAMVRELEQYREIGTPEECKAALENLSKISKVDETKMTADMVTASSDTNKTIVNYSDL